jgi:hypothetical protein
MSRQYFEELMEPVVVAAQTQIAGTAEAAMWNMTGASPPPPTLIPANTVRPGMILAVRAWGTMTTPASAATTMIITPRWGTTTGGTALGASNVSNTAIISRTADPWFLDFALTIRSVGATGTAVGGGRFTCPAIGTAAANPGNLVFGGTVATIDTTVASGIWMGATLAGSASWTLITQGVAFEFLN